MQWLFDLCAFVLAVLANWLFWLATILMVEPLADHWAPKSWERVKGALKWQTERRHTVTRWVGGVLLFIACFQAWDDQYKAASVARSEVSATRWDALTEDQISQLQSRLALIEPEQVRIECETPNCKDLAESFAEAFRRATWPDVKLIFQGGMGITGVYNLTINPGDNKTDKIISAIEGATSLKIESPQVQRASLQPYPGVDFVIGEKPF